jgi:hypothetical protein
VPEIKTGDESETVRHFSTAGFEDPFFGSHHEKPAYSGNTYYRGGRMSSEIQSERKARWVT